MYSGNNWSEVHLTSHFFCCPNFSSTKQGYNSVLREKLIEGDVVRNIAIF